MTEPHNNRDDDWVTFSYEGSILPVAVTALIICAAWIIVRFWGHC